MRYHDAMVAKRWRKIVLGMFLAPLGLAVASLPNSQAQMRYSGGFRIMRQNPPKYPTSQQSAPNMTAPAVPKISPSYSPDNDFVYSSYYPGGEPKRPLPSPANPLPYGLSPANLPWNQAGFEDYNEIPQMPQDLSLWEPKKYSLAATPLPLAPIAERPETALLIAHLPEHAVVWVAGTRTRSTGRTRYFQSPPLPSGRKYDYRVRVAWIEDGRWVSQTRKVPVQAGLIQAIYLQLAPPLPERAAMK
jgi:uncharacterized protein (TIGR03000 family)